MISILVGPVTWLSGQPARIACGFAVALSLLGATPCAAREAHQTLAQVASQPPVPATADDAFLAMREAVREGDLDGATALGQVVLSLEPNYPLAGYIQYYRLNQRLKNLSDPPPDDEVRAFIERNDGSLVADLARRDWLLALGERADFLTFDAVYPKYQIRDDAQVNCYSILARYYRRERHSLEFSAALESDARIALSRPRDILGDGCATLAATFAVAQHIPTSEIWQWARLASDQNSLPALKTYLALLPRPDAISASQIEAVYNKPVLWLAQRQGQSLHGQRDLAVVALARMARSEPEQAAPIFTRYWAARLSADDRGYIWAEIGAAASKRELPQAAEWSRRSLDVKNLSEDLLAARARAALRDQNWSLLQLFIEKMPPEMRSPQAHGGTWTYWLARCDAARENTVASVELYARIASQFTFYGQLAREALGQPLALPARAAPVTQAELSEAETNPGFARARKFFQLDLRAQGNFEWNYTLRGMDDRQLLAAADWALRNQFLDRAVNTADRTKNEHDFTVRFLAPYEDVMQQKVDASGLNLDWVYGLIRQESRFVLVAHSYAGASGLMQLMPQTARYVAKKIGMSGYDPGQVSDMDTNLTLGTSYLRMILDQLDDNEILATAAYNAGPARVRAWRAGLPGPVEGAIFAETIPFPETRDYVKQVMSNAIYYHLRFKPSAPASLRARMGVISPADYSGPGDLP